MNDYISHIKLLLKRLLLLLAVFELSRIFFFILNISQFSPISSLEFFGILFWGLRFDFAAIFYLNILFILLHLIPGDFKNKSGYQKTLKIIFIVINSIILLPNFVDCAYYHYLNKRSTADLFKLFEMGNDVVSLLPQYLKDFWYVLLSWIITMTGAWFLYPKSFKIKEPTSNITAKRFLQQTLFSIGIIGIFFSLARGFEYKPLRIISALDYTQPKFVPLVLNSPFTILNTYNIDQLQDKKYFTAKECSSIFNPVQKFPMRGNIRKHNVVIIILESFSKEYSGFLNHRAGYIPFLDSLMQKGFICTNAFANGKRSIEAVPAIVAGLPSLMNDPYISSNYSTNKINSLATLLKPYGYYSAFFHGGSNGTMSFDKFSKAAGFDAYSGRTEYNNEKDFDGNWGIYDEPFLQYFANSMNKYKEPFFTCMFTLSSHHPYAVPKKYKGKFSKGELEIHESIQYADYSLRKFFETASTMPWYNNTLFILTADHTAPVTETYYQNKVGVFAIPILFYMPGDTTLHGTNNTIMQQSDIMPSALDYLHFDKTFLSYGNSIFNNNSNHFVINYLDNYYQLVEDHFAFQFDGEKNLAMYDLSKDSLLTKNLVDSLKPEVNKLEKRIKAIIQSYNNRMLNNRLIP